MNYRNAIECGTLWALVASALAVIVTTVMSPVAAGVLVMTTGVPPSAVKRRK